MRLLYLLKILLIQPFSFVWSDPRYKFVPHISDVTVMSLLLLIRAWSLQAIVSFFDHDYILNIMLSFYGCLFMMYDASVISLINMIFKKNMPVLLQISILAVQQYQLLPTLLKILKF